MREIGTFALQIEPSTTARPTRVTIVVAGTSSVDQSSLPLARPCLSLDELEGEINGLQDELDILRSEARRAFADDAGHA